MSENVSTDRATHRSTRMRAGESPPSQVVPISQAPTLLRVGTPIAIGIAPGKRGKEPIVHLVHADFSAHADPDAFAYVASAAVFGRMGVGDGPVAMLSFAGSLPPLGIAASFGKLMLEEGAWATPSRYRLFDTVDGPVAWCVADIRHAQAVPITSAGAARGNARVLFAPVGPNMAVEVVQGRSDMRLLNLLNMREILAAEEPSRQKCPWGRSGNVVYLPHPVVAISDGYWKGKQANGVLLQDELRVLVTMESIKGTMCQVVDLHLPGSPFRARPPQFMLRSEPFPLEEGGNTRPLAIGPEGVAVARRADGFRFMEVRPPEAFTNAFAQALKF